MQGGKFEIVKVGDLNPADYNPRKIKPEVMARLKKGIEEFGVVEPLVVNQDNTLIGGHMRLRAATELGIDEVPCFRVDVDKKREKALNLALNKLSGEWDYDKLTGLLGELEGLGDLDLELTGFDDAEVIELTELGDSFGDMDFGDDDFSAGAAGSAPDGFGGDERGYAIQYTLIFNDEAEQEVWRGWLKQLKEQYPDMETISERIVAAIGEKNG
jgi:hypothetical protein